MYKKIIELYDEGVVTHHEAINRLIECCDDLNELPMEWRSWVVESVNQAPTTDEEWSKLVFVASWSGLGTPPSQEEQRTAYRKRVEFLRERLGCSNK